MPRKQTSGGRQASRFKPPLNRGSRKNAKRHSESAAQVAKSLPNELPLTTATADLPLAILAKRTTHPNVFRKRIRTLTGTPDIGDWVRVENELDTTESDDPGLLASQSAPQTTQLGYGLYNPKSEIAIRLVSWQPEPPDATYWDAILRRAVSLRQDTLSLDRTCNTYRVLHSEADGVPGLVVDRYDNCLSAEVYSAAMAPRAKAIICRLAEILGTEHWLIQPGPFLQSQEGYTFGAYSSPSLPKSVEIRERGTRYRVDFHTGHKTGFFCDQRDNRHLVAQHCRGKSVLDVCCYTGGFSIMAAHEGQASSVTAVDLDADPLQTAASNARLNGVDVKFTQADAFGYMRDMIRNGRRFDVVVLDPPKLIRNRAELEEGTRKHFDLNRLAMQLVEPGGMLLTCSCAGLLQEHDFTRLVRAAGRSAFLPSELNPNATPRNIQILGKSGAASCHPVSANCPETEYLKAMWLRL